MAISILILTLNEEINIQKCIESIDWSDDIVVLDSMSTDNTKKLAVESNARVIERKFDNWSSHQNWAMKNIEFVYPWVLYIDADERCTIELEDEITQIIKNTDPKESAFRLRRKDFFMDQWLRRAQLYPTWIIRLFRPEKIRYERLVNPVAVVDGLVGELKSHLNHYPFSHGISHWIARHNRYSDMEAVEADKVNSERSICFSRIMSKDKNVRRMELKNLFYLLPGRPLIKFFYYYFFRMGFLDKKPGFIYCVLQAFYEFLIVIKVREKKFKAQIKMNGYSQSFKE